MNSETESDESAINVNMIRNESDSNDELDDSDDELNTTAVCPVLTRKQASR